MLRGNGVWQWAEFLQGYQPNYDLVLMDVEMPGLDGLETARELRMLDRAVILIFITNMAQYAIRGYEVDAWTICSSRWATPPLPSV